MPVSSGGGRDSRPRGRPRRPLTWASLGVVVAAVEGAGTRLVAVAGPVGAVGPPAGAEAGRAAAGAAEPAGGTAGGGAAGQGRQHQQRQQRGPARHGSASDLHSPLCRLKGRGGGGEGAGPPPPRPSPAAERGKAAGRSPGATGTDGGESPAAAASSPGRSVSPASPSWTDTGPPQGFERAAGAAPGLLAPEPGCGQRPTTGLGQRSVFTQISVVSPTLTVTFLRLNLCGIS